MSVPVKKEKKQLTPVEIEKITNRLQAGRFFIFKNYPFLGHILQRLNVVITYDTPTMAVDDVGNMYMNYDFSMSLPFPEFVGVLAHETMHIATLTFYRERGRDHQLWNIATDYIMNRDILKSGMALPAMALLPEKVGNNYQVKFNGKKGPVVIDITDATAEYLYSQIVKNAVKINVSTFDQTIKTNGKGSKNGKDADGNPIPQPLEGTPGPGNKSPEEIRNIVVASEQAAKMDQEELEKSRGEGSGGLREHIMSLHRPKVNWKQLLKNIVAKTVTEYNWRRPHKRALAAGYYAPRSQTQDNLAPIVVAIDTSGSISQKELSVFVTEITNIFRQFPRATITVVLWESQAYYDIVVTNSNVGSLTANILKHVQYGGTTMSSVANYLIQKGLDKKVAAVVYLTDGHVESSPKLLPLPIKNYALVTDLHGMKGISETRNLKCFPIEIN